MHNYCGYNDVPFSNTENLHEWKKPEVSEEIQYIYRNLTQLKKLTTHRNCTALCRGQQRSLDWPFRSSKLTNIFQQGITSYVFLHFTKTISRNLQLTDSRSTLTIISEILPTHRWSTPNRLLQNIIECSWPLSWRNAEFLPGHQNIGTSE